MVQIHSLSDLHYEIYARDFVDRLPHPQADCLVMAGDYHRTRHVVKHLRSATQFPDIPIVFVAGNHEHYGTRASPAEDILQLRADAEKDRKDHRRETWFLENDAIELSLGGEQIRFIGATLWTDFQLFGNPVKHADYAQSAMNDFIYIRSDVKNTFELRPSETVAWHNRSRKFIEAELRKPFAGKTVVVTHHTPSRRSVHPRFRNDPLTPAFSSNRDDLLALGADLWIHGHTHDSFDYMAGRTRVVCNPRGYGRGVGPISENRDFRADLVVQI
jgi:predicted phosphodiesterase